MSATQTKLQPSDLQNKIGSQVVIRENVYNSEIRGTVLAYDSVKQMVQIDVNRSHQWVSTAANSGVYIFQVSNG